MYVLWGSPTVSQPLLVESTKMYLSYIYGAQTTFSQIDLTISIKEARPTSSCFVKALPVSLRFNNVLPVIRLLQVGACSASQEEKLVYCEMPAALSCGTSQM